jgi:hypothetical protein
MGHLHPKALKTIVASVFLDKPTNQNIKKTIMISPKN